jgi:hypothetical protein
MAKDEYFICVEGVIGELAGIEITVPRGFVATSDNPIAQKFAKVFVPVVGGAEIVAKRRFEIAQATEAARAKPRDDLRAARIAQGDRPDPADDLNVEAIKKAVKANSDLELVHDPQTGLVTGARSKAGHIMTG